MESDHLHNVGGKKILRRAVANTNLRRSVQQAFCIRLLSKPTVVEAHEAAVLKLVSLSRGFVYKVARSSVHTVTQIFTLFKLK